MAEAGAHLTDCESSIDDITKCSICFETFKNPKCLPCIHTFCLDCLKTMCKGKKSGDEGLCPLCREVFTIPQDGVQNLRNNFYINQLLQRPVLRSMTKTEVRFCEEHPTEQIKLYCFDCESVACLVCHVLEHSQHKCTDVKKSAKELGLKLNDDIQKLTKCILEKKKIVADKETEKKSFLERVTATEDKISRKSDELIALVKTHRNQLLTDLNSCKEKHLEEEKGKKYEVEKQIRHMESLKAYCKDIQERGTFCDISQQANGLHARAKNLVMVENKKQCSNKRVSGRFVPEPEPDNNMIGKLLKGYTTYELEKDGYIAIIDCPPDSHCVTLENTHGKAVSIAEFKLCQSSGKKKEQVFTFSKKCPALASGSKITVWAKNQKPANAPSIDKECDYKNWGTGDKVTTTLIDVDYKCIATHIQKTTFD